MASVDWSVRMRLGVALGKEWAAKGGDEGRRTWLTLFQQRHPSQASLAIWPLAPGHPYCYSSSTNEPMWHAVQDYPYWDAPDRMRPDLSGILGMEGSSALYGLSILYGILHARAATTRSQPWESQGGTNWQAVVHWQGEPCPRCCWPVSLEHVLAPGAERQMLSLSC